MKIVPVTRKTFPLNQPVIVEAIIDSRSGWEFDAPMHIMTPFHRYCEIGSLGFGALQDRLEEILVDLTCDIELKPDDHAWPYSAKTLDRYLQQARRGKARNGIDLYVARVIVTDWSDHKDRPQWEIRQVEPANRP